MSDPLQRLFDRAFRRASAAEANAVIAQVRQDEAGELEEALNYEIVLPAADPVGFLTTRALPRLVYFLECRGVRIPECPQVFVSLFVEDQLYFLHCGDFIDELASLTGLSPAQMRKQFGE